MLFKIKWFLCALLLSFFLKKIQFPSYFAFPVFCTGLKRVSVGKRVRVFPGCRFETHGHGVIIIEDNVSIAQNVHVTSAAKLVIGEGTLITANVFITTIDHDYKEISVPVLEQKIIAKDTIIGRNCFIGMGAAIQAGTKLGQQCVVGANSVVRGEFPDFCVIAGAPARIIKKYNIGTGVWERV